MTEEERARMESVPWPLAHAAAENPRMQAALHRHVFGAGPLVAVLRAAHEDLVADMAEKCEFAAVLTPEAPPWPEGPLEEVTQDQVDALLGALQLHRAAARAAEDRLALIPPTFRVVLPVDAAERVAARLGSAEFRAAMRDAIVEAANGVPAPAPSPWLNRTGRLR